MKLLNLWAWARATLAVLIVAAVGRQTLDLVVRANDSQIDTAMELANFFSYFTIMSNLFAAFTLSCAAWFRFRHQSSREPLLITSALHSAAMCLAVTGLVYNTVLRSADPRGASFDWTNEVVHVLAPLFLIVDVTLSLGCALLPWRKLWQTMVLPIAWLAYTLVRGGLVTDPVTGAPYWYPYDFLNPHRQPGGWAGVSIVLATIICVAVALSVLMTWWSRKRARAQELFAAS